MLNQSIRYLSLVFLLLSFKFSIGQANIKDGEPLFQITENGMAGFINANGKIVIPTIYRTADEFSEGLANVRSEGGYGYINKIEKFVIQPQYDFAMPFSEGLAIVYKDGLPLCINKKGEKIVETNFSDVSSFKNGRASVVTETGKQGYINTLGKLFIDTIYKEINPFINGLAVVRVENGVGVIDTLGNVVIPFGKFEGITDFNDGYFKTEIRANPSDFIIGYQYYSTIIDKNAKQIISVSDKNHCRIAESLHCGLAKVYLTKHTKTKESYQGYINLQSEVSINDTNYIYVTNFSENRAFVEDKNRKHFIINTAGKQISKDKYDGVHEQGFKNGLAFVKDDRWQWGLVDTNANYVVKPKFERIDDVGIIDDYFFFSESNPDEGSNFDELVGVAKIDGGIIVKPIIEKFDKRGFYSGLLKCSIKGKLTYISKSGKIIWQANESKNQQLSNLNIDFMNRGYFYAYSKLNKNDLGGFGSSKNIPQKMGLLKILRQTC